MGIQYPDVELPTVQPTAGAFLIAAGLRPRDGHSLLAVVGRPLSMIPTVHEQGGQVLPERLHRAEHHRLDFRTGSPAARRVASTRCAYCSSRTKTYASCVNGSTIRTGWPCAIACRCSVSSSIMARLQHPHTARAVEWTAVEPRHGGARLSSEGSQPGSNRPGGRDLRDDRIDQLLGDESLQALGAAVAHDLLDQRAGDVRVLGVGHEEDRLDRRVEPVIGQRHAELVLHVGERPQPAEDHPRPDPADVLDGQPLERLDRDVGESG